MPFSSVTAREGGTRSAGASSRCQQAGQFLDPLGGQFALALGKAQHGALLVQAQGEYGGTWRGVRQDGACHRLFAVDHQGTASQVAQALEGWMLQATECPQAIAERQHVDKAQKIAGQRGGPADWRAVVMHHAQPHQLLAGRTTLIEHFEQHHVPPTDQEHQDRTESGAELVQ